MEANDTIAQIRTADEREIINDGYSNAIDQAEGYQKRRSIRYFKFPKIKGGKTAAR